MGPVMEVSVQLGCEAVHAARPLGVRGNCLELLGFCHNIAACPQKERNHFAVQKPLSTHFGVSH